MEMLDTRLLLASADVVFSSSALANLVLADTDPAENWKMSAHAKHTLQPSRAIYKTFL